MMGKVLQLLKVIVASVAVSIILALIFAFLAYKLQMEDAQIAICVSVIYVIGSFIGGFGMGKLKKEKRLIWGMISGVVYMLLVMVISLILNDFMIDFGKVLSGMAICIAAGGIGGVLG